MVTIPKPRNPQSSVNYSVAQKASANVAKAEKISEMVYGEIFLRITNNGQLGTKSWKQDVSND